MWSGFLILFASSIPVLIALWLPLSTPVSAHWPFIGTSSNTYTFQRDMEVGEDLGVELLGDGGTFHLPSLSQELTVGQGGACQDRTG